MLKRYSLQLTEAEMVKIIKIVEKMQEPEFKHWASIDRNTKYMRNLKKKNPVN